MNKLILLLLSVTVASTVAGCASVADESSPSAQRSRADKTQNELGTEVSKQKTGQERY